MKLILVGLGKMGSQIAQNLINDGNQVVAVDPNPDAVSAAANFGAISSTDRKDAISKFENEQVIVWLMIPSKFVQDEIPKWLSILPKNSLLIDGGNTDFRKTKKHADMASSYDIKFVDVGVSGGILGTENGFSMMAGGDEESYLHIKPILDSLSKPRGGHEYFGESGSGHYVKMVHNAIEYGMMESIAEGYRMLHEGPYDNLDIAKAGEVWQRASVIESTLNRLSAEAVSEDRELQDASGYVAESGEGRWTIEVAKQHGVHMPAIESALNVRLASEKGETNYSTKLLAVMRNKFGGHPLNKQG